jgi:hypothetical protein
MAKRYFADDDIAAALAHLARIEASAATWAPQKSGPLVAAEGDDLRVADMTDAVAAVATASSPLLRFVRHVDDDIDAIIAQASDTDRPAFGERMLRRLRLRRTPQDMRRRDAVLSVRLVALLEQVASVIAALDRHRQAMKSQLIAIEADLDRRIGKAKSIDGEAMSDATRELTSRQDIVEAIIRHEAACNSFFHKLSIEAERGIVVLKALSAGQAMPIADSFSTTARDILAPLLALSGKNMLAMREVGRRKQVIDHALQHRFEPAASPRQNVPDTEPGTAPSAEQAPA